jgi:hypothetical protein
MYIHVGKMDVWGPTPRASILEYVCVIIIIVLPTHDARKHHPDSPSKHNNTHKLSHNHLSHLITIPRWTAGMKPTTEQWVSRCTPCAENSWRTGDFGMWTSDSWYGSTTCHAIEECGQGCIGIHTMRPWHGQNGRTTARWWVAPKTRLDVKHVYLQDRHRMQWGETCGVHAGRACHRESTVFGLARPTTGMKTYARTVNARLNMGVATATTTVKYASGTTTTSMVSFKRASIVDPAWRCTTTTTFSIAAWYARTTPR